MAGNQGQPSPKPQSLPAQPGAIPEGSALGDYKPPQGSALETYDPMAASAASQDASSAPAPEGQSVTSQVLDATGRTLDYPGGGVRTALATGAGMIQNAVQGKNPLDQTIVTGEDAKAALVGKAPNSAEYLRRLGVSEGGSMNLPGLGRVTLRGAEGLALDVLSDPLTIIAKAIKGAPYIAKLLETPGRATEALGEAVYKSAITAKDSRKAKVAGQAMIEAGAPIGGQAALETKIADVAKTIGGLRQGLYDKFAQVGSGVIDVTEGTFQNARGVLKGLRKDPTLSPLADEFEAMLNKYQGQGFVPMDVMSAWKTNLYDSIPKSAWNGAKLSNPGKMFKAALAKDFKTAIVDSGNKVEAGLGDAIDHLNDKWGALLEAKPQKNPMGGSLGKVIDGVTYAFGGISGLIKKKALEVAVGPHGKTISGKALMAAGKSDYINRLVRQEMANQTTDRKQGGSD